MKTIIIEMNEKDVEELGILSDHISFSELESKLLVRSLREKRASLEKSNKEYGFDKLTEEEIFETLNEETAAYNTDKKHADAKAKISD